MGKDITVTPDYSRYVWKTKEQMMPLPELLRYDHDPDKYTNIGMRSYHGFLGLKDYPEMAEAATDLLAKLGMHRFSYLDHGSHGLLLSTTDNQIVRISQNAKEGPRLEHPAIMQPKASFVLKGKQLFGFIPTASPSIRVEILAQVQHTPIKRGDKSAITTYGVTERHVKQLKAAFEKSGLDPFDVEKRNIALMSDGTPLVIDSGAVAVIKDKPWTNEGDFLKSWLCKDASGKRSWKQHVLCPESVNKELSGTITPDNIHSLKEALGSRSNIVKAASQDGLYRDELGNLIVRAANNQEQDREESRLLGRKPKSFRAAMQEEREKNKYPSADLVRR